MLTKNDSKVLKGISILIMIWLHTFLYKNNVDLLTCSIYIGNMPLVILIRNFCGICIHLYLFLGGYGLYICYINRNLHSSWRVFYLYLNYWIMLIMVLSIGVIINPSIYPGSFVKFLSNFVAINYSYNSTWWFLFPYILIILTSKKLFALLSKYNGVTLFLNTLFINLLTSYTISKFGDKYLFHNLFLYIPLLFFHLLNAFVTGAIFAKYDIFKYIKNQIKRIHYSNIICVVSLLGLILLKGYVTTSIVNIFAVCLFFIFFYTLEKPRWLSNLLSKLGEGSTNMWFIHAFVCFYFLHDFTYSLKYPIIVFLFVVILSYLVHLIINTLFIRSKRFILDNIIKKQDRINLI